MTTVWWYRLARSIYGLQDSKIENCDLVVPIGYGLTARNELPDAEIKVISKAVQIAKMYKAIIVWANSRHYLPGCEEKENEEKLKLLRKEVLRFLVVASGTINSVTEASEIKRAILRAGLNHRDIVVVLDWPHAKSAKIIWKKIFTDSNIAIVSVEGQWDSPHQAVFLKSKLRWLVANIFRHLALIFLGIEWVARKRYSTIY